MPPTSFYADATYNNRQSPEGFEPDLTTDDAELLVDDLLDLEIDSTGAASLRQNASRRTTDLVRLYLQEIGRVHLLERDEEVSEAQKVQRHLRMRLLLSGTDDIADEVIQALCSVN